MSNILTHQILAIKECVSVNIVTQFILERVTTTITYMHDEIPIQGEKLYYLCFTMKASIGALRFTE